MAKANGKPRKKRKSPLSELEAAAAIILKSTDTPTVTGAGDYQYITISDVPIRLPKMPPATQILNSEFTDLYDQRWKRPRAPKGFEDAYISMIDRQKATVDMETYELTDSEKGLWAYMEQEYSRLRNGVWFMNKGEPTYITGIHYFFLTDFTLKTGQYANYRDTDRDWFLFYDFCMRHPSVKGMLNMENRQTGKTAKSSCVLLYLAIMYRHMHAYIQSRDHDASAIVFRTAVAPAFKGLPAWLKPNTSKTVTTSLSLKAPETTMGFDNQHNILDKTLSLNSFIECAKNGESNALNGTTPGFVYTDEYGSSSGIDILHRHNTNAESAKKMLYTTTIQDMSDPRNLNQVREIWDQSSYEEFLKEGTTTSGLLRYFKPAHRGLQRLDVTPKEDFVDAWGRSMEKEALDHILKIRKKFKDTPRVLMQKIRFQPLTPEEAMTPDTEGCPFDVNILTTRRTEIEACMSRGDLKDSYGANIARRCHLSWKNGVPFSEVEYQFTPTGNFLISFLPEKMNNVDWVTIGGAKKVQTPKNKQYSLGIDPYNFTRVSSRANKLSKGAGEVYWKEDELNPHSGRVAASYNFRPMSNDMFYDDMILLSWFYGCQMTIERNNDKLLDRLEAVGMYDTFVRNKHRKPKDINKRVASSGNEKGEFTSRDTLIHMTELIQTFVIRNGHKIDDPALINQMFMWNIENSNDFDMIIALGYALIGATSLEIIESLPTGNSDLKEIMLNFVGSRSYNQ